MVTRDGYGTAESTGRNHWTTIVLEECNDGEWVATQTGVDVEGRGETAAQAATRYCRAIAEGGR
jgi:hypothetical protein